MISTEATRLEMTAFLGPGIDRQYTGSGAIDKAKRPAGDDGHRPLLADEVGSVTPSTSNPPTGETRPAMCKTRREKEMIRKRQYHRRLKNERDTLRSMVDELSRQLQELQHRTQVHDTLKAGGVIVKSSWKESALRQRDLRMFAESEQMRLFAAAKLQASFIKKLCEELPNGSTHLRPPSLSRRVSPYQSGLPIDESLYHALADKVAACYAQIDDVLSEFDRDGVTTSVHRDENDGEIQYFQHLNQFTEPYGYQHTHQTMWKLAKLLHRQQDRRDLHGPGTPNDTVVIRFRLLRTLANGETISVLQRYVHRRFQEDKRTVLVWKTLSEGEDVFRGAHSEETGWVCLQPSTEEDSTLVRVCVRQAPLRLQVPYRLDALVGKFHQVLQSSVSEDMQEVSNALDKMLLDDTLEGIDI